MSFYERMAALETEPLASTLSEATEADVERVLAGSRIGAEGFLVLLSEAAGTYLEPMARRAQQLTVQNFGRVILLYTPLYLANYCANSCRYCGFAVGNPIPRRRLTLEEVSREGAEIRASGLRHLLVLTGDSRTKSPVEYIRECVEVLTDSFASISVEVYALTTEEYGELIAAGVDGLTIYQETYDPQVYAQVHPRGPKRDFRFRLEAPERAADAGMRAVNVGALLGLADWRLDSFFTGLHAHYLQQRYPEVEVSISLPRLRPHEGSYQPQHVLRDREFVQLLLATRLFLPRVGITLSTRESAQFRDNLITLGVTKMSAGSCTAVGGRTLAEAQVGQFDIFDGRDVRAVKQAIESHGYQAIFKDWHMLDDRDPAVFSPRADQAAGPALEGVRRA